MNELERLFEHFGSQRKLAFALGLKPMAITHWKSRGVPGKRAIQIEQLTNGEFKAVELTAEAV